jgi:integrase
MGVSFLEGREMRQNRHSFATNSLICGETPLWITKIMGHHNTDMIINVYLKHIEDAKGMTDGTFLAAAYGKAISNI